MNNIGTPRGFGEQGKRGIYFIGTGNQKPNFEGNKDNIGDQFTLANDIFRFVETGEQANLFQGNKGTGTPLGGPQQLPMSTYQNMLLRHFALTPLLTYLPRTEM